MPEPKQENLVPIGTLMANTNMDVVAAMGDYAVIIGRYDENMQVGFFMVTRVEHYEDTNTITPMDLTILAAKVLHQIGIEILGVGMQQPPETLPFDPKDN